MGEIARPQVVAHRGASSAFAENTVAAFRGAVTLGADGVELDVRRCADGTLAVHHDPVLAASGVALAALSGPELPEEVPDLATALAASEPLWVNVEIKHGHDEPGYDPSHRVADDVAAVLAAAGPADRFLVSSFDPAVLDRFRAVAPAVATGLLVFDLRHPADVVAQAVAGGHTALHPWEHMVDAEVVGRAHDAGLAVNVWTVDDPDRMRELAAIGVDAVITNVPDVALAALGSGP
ncbi:MAG: glycerophosphodiester phosphodiesterase [Acidimicrobiales bacterium]